MTAESADGDRSPQDIVGIRKVDDNSLVLPIDFLPYTDEMVAFKRKRLVEVKVSTRVQKTIRARELLAYACQGHVHTWNEMEAG